MWFKMVLFRFLVTAIQLLDKHLDTEGLFRKAGSVTRQKELRVIVNK